MEALFEQWDREDRKVRTYNLMDHLVGSAVMSIGAAGLFDNHVRGALRLGSGYRPAKGVISKPTSKRATVKAARKANVRRMRGAA
jgi:hypothetical protein